MELCRAGKDLAWAFVLGLLALALLAAFGGAEGAAGTTVASKSLFALQGSLCVAAGFLVGRMVPLLVWKAWSNRSQWAGRGGSGGKE